MNVIIRTPLQVGYDLSIPSNNLRGIFLMINRYCFIIVHCTPFMNQNCPLYRKQEGCDLLLKVMDNVAEPYYFDAAPEPDFCCSGAGSYLKSPPYRRNLKSVKKMTNAE